MLLLPVMALSLMLLMVFHPLAAKPRAVHGERIRTRNSQRT